MDDDAEERDKREGNELLASGALIGVVGAALGVVSGAVCPVCVVATPALLGIGAYKRFRARKKNTTHEARTTTE